jgi:arylsulfatase A-like enzyme
MYDPADVPIPATFSLGVENKPPQHTGYRRSGRRVNYEHLTEEKLRRCIAYYYGSISLVDDQVGKIVAALDESGLLDSTVLVFVSDHGELLGHFGMLIKSVDRYPMLYDVGLKVPCILRTPDHLTSAARAGRVVERPIELIDLFPTVLEAAGLEVTPEAQGYSLVPAMRGGDAPERRFVFAETGAVKMIRGDRYKLVYYPGQEYGELYDIVADPDEVRNRYGDPALGKVREMMIQALLDRLIYTEGARHGESQRGSAYWKTMYRLPFEPTET